MDELVGMIGSLSSFKLVLLPLIVIVMSVIFGRRLREGNENTTPTRRRSTNSTKNSTEVDAAIDRALHMRSIISEMPKDKPRVPERDRDYRMKRKVLIGDR